MGLRAIPRQAHQSDHDSGHTDAGHVARWFLAMEREQTVLITVRMLQSVFLALRTLKSPGRVSNSMNQCHSNTLQHLYTSGSGLEGGWRHGVLVVAISIAATGKVEKRISMVRINMIRAPV